MKLVSSTCRSTLRTTFSDPPPFGPKIQYHKHENTAAQMSFFGGLKKEDLPDGAGWAVENVSLDPQRRPSRRAYRFHPTMNRAARHHHRRGAARMVLPARRE